MEIGFIFSGKMILIHTHPPSIGATQIIRGAPAPGRLRRGWLVFAFLAATVAGCSRMPADYAKFEPVYGQLVMEVQYIDPSQASEIRKAVETVAGVKSGSVMVNPGGRYVALTLTNPDDMSQGPVNVRVEEKLLEMEVKVLRSKTRVP